MALYLGSNRILPLMVDDYTWWGGKNAKFIYECSSVQTVADSTNWSDLAITTSAKSLTYTTALTTTANANAVLERWGSGNGNSISTDKLDFSKYTYIVLADAYVDFQYKVTESTMGQIHGVRYMSTGIIPLFLRVTGMDGNNLLYIDGSTNGTFTSVAPVTALYIYRKANNTLATYSAGYGIYCTPVAPTFSPSSGLIANYINFRAPTISVRYSNSYNVLAALDDDVLDAANTKIYCRQRLYQIDRDSAFQKAANRLGYMYENNAFPTEII